MKNEHQNEVEIFNFEICVSGKIDKNSPKKEQNSAWAIFEKLKKMKFKKLNQDWFVNKRI